MDKTRDDDRDPAAATPAGRETISERPRALSPAARRALAEAEERRRLRDEAAARSAPAREVHGRGGLDPVRYNDWEVKGLASDF